MNLSEMLERNSRMFPEKTALVERTPGIGLRKTISWKELNERVSRLANGLRDRGVKKGDRVIIWMLNSLNWLEAYLGILRAGAWAVPLNHRFTSGEFKYCMDVAEPSAMFLDEEFVEKVGAAGPLPCPPGHLIIIGDRTPRQGMTGYEDLISAASSREVASEMRDDDPCGRYFTSGTTGDPKPILLMHKNMECSAITEVVHGLRNPGDIFVILKPLYHTGDKMHWLSSLILGETAVIQRGRITPQTIFEAIHEERGTVAMLLVPWIQDILTALDGGELHKEDYDLSSWRLVLFGAQPVPPMLLTRWRKWFPEMEYEINFGLTESSGPGCIHLAMADEHKLGSIGKPGFNWEACIIGENGAAASAGEIGEIAVRGNGVMKEYYKNPEKTADTLKKGWLHTGDMGRMDADGFIWLVDRKKDVIFYGGENIYPAEIEEVLQNHPKVHDVGVIGITDSRLGEVVAAVIELEPNATASAATEEEIKRFCEENLPNYKRPRRIFIGEVPRSPTGKIEKLMLRRKYGG
jgi:acyl-CoA synthetase (AMP-forming)/AMP-acid ligase II